MCFYRWHLCEHSVCYEEKAAKRLLDSTTTNVRTQKEHIENRNKKKKSSLTIERSKFYYIKLSHYTTTNYTAIESVWRKNTQRRLTILCLFDSLCIQTIVEIKVIWKIYQILFFVLIRNQFERFFRVAQQK